MTTQSIGAKAFGVLQKTGKSLMLPVAVLPVAGILLGVGAANFSWMPEAIGTIMRESGGAVFGNMALIFAVAVALGFSDNDGVAAVAATVGYAVMLATMGVMAELRGLEPATVMGMKSMETGVFGGILAGGVAAIMFNRFFRISLPPYLGFFAGKRFVPIITAIAAIGLGVVLAFVWPPIQGGIDVFSHWAASENPRMAATIYGFVERMLVPFGLHHIWNAPFFYEVGSFVDPATGKAVTGDIQRFFAGDPTAGILSGAFLFKMFGLPGAALAIWHTAKKERRVAIGGIMLSAALTSFLTGITEPIEFSFMFVAPVLYLIHAFIVAGCQFLMATLGAHMGFTFSQGGIDFLMFNVLNPHAQKWAYVLVLGPLTGLLYYVVFRAVIQMWDLKTPGREDDDGAAGGGEAVSTEGAGGFAGQLVVAFGGRDNIQDLDACITRLRITVKDKAAVNKAALKSLGASGVMEVGNNMQAVFGPLSENYKTDMEAYLRSTSDDSAARAASAAPAAQPVSAPAASAASAASAAPAAEPEAPVRSRKRAGQAPQILAALGGKGAVESVRVFGLTRILCELRGNSGVDEAALKSLGAAALKTSDKVVQVVVGDADAALLADELAALI